jgi:hypothetical protein
MGIENSEVEMEQVLSPVRSHHLHLVVYLCHQVEGNVNGHQEDSSMRVRVTQAPGSVLDFVTHYDPIHLIKGTKGFRKHTSK